MLNIKKLIQKNQPLQICPHENCGQPLHDIIREKGIWFCPHCQQSLLSEPILTLEQLNEIPNNSTEKFNYKDISPKYFFLIMGCLLLVLVINLLNIGYLWLVVQIGWFAYVCFSQRKNIKKPIFKGVDKLADVKQQDQHFVTPTGELQCVVFKRALQGGNYQRVTGCPHCLSQQMADVSHYLNMNLNFYENHNISKPAQLPNGVYDKKTRTYIDHHPLVKKLVLCLNCHSHFIWQKHQYSGLKNLKNLALLVLWFVMLIGLLVFGWLLMNWLLTSAETLITAYPVIDIKNVLDFLIKWLLSSVAMSIMLFLSFFLPIRFGLKNAVHFSQFRLHQFDEKSE